MISLSKELKRRARASTGFSLRIKANTNKSGKSITLAFNIPLTLIDELRWINKDRIDMLWDAKQKEGQLVRIPNSTDGSLAGWGLSFGRSENAAGRLTITIPDGIGFNENLKLKEHITTNNTIIFRLE